jgi:hypothetical protein
MPMRHRRLVADQVLYLGPRIDNPEGAHSALPGYPNVRACTLAVSSCHGKFLRGFGDHCTAITPSASNRQKVSPLV